MDTGGASVIVPIRLTTDAGDGSTLEQQQEEQQQQLQHEQQQLQQQQLPADEGTNSSSVLSCEVGDADVNYFKSYSSIHVHEEMLADTIRTNAYRWAILKNYRDLYRRCVLDIGAGTGILSVFAVQAGAKKVYAIEASAMARHARQVVQENNMADRIQVIEQRAEDADLPEKVDAIISEWMGYCLFYESMLPSVLKARDRFLKPGGLMFPCKATLYLAPIHDEDYLHRLEFWGEVKNLYKVSMETMAAAAHACLTADADIRAIPVEAVQAHAAQVCCLDLTSALCTDLEHIQSPFTFRCFGHTSITGFVTWFTVHFPGGFSLSTSPYEPQTHWAQTVLYLRHSLHVQQDTEIRGTFLMTPHKSNHRSMEIQLKFSVSGDERQHCQSFSLCHTYSGGAHCPDAAAQSASSLP
ncbi:protein arginine N-methyltransferase 6-like isoform X2 [Babylonia areolata]|uniref:protein arginine N-methyltransferase 6-like isoform X2 n=1 Tax=Babylonia areolata TaxID=304850 RepID=UPI003FD174FA